jgi:uncharacterized membrane protein YkgB
VGIATTVGAVITIIVAIVILPLWATILGVVCTVSGFSIFILQTIKYFGG